MTLLLREADVHALLSMEDALDLMEELFSAERRSRAVNQPRRRVGTGQGTLNVMFAALPSRGVCGLKAYPVSRGGVNFTVLLYDSSSSELLAIVEAGRLGQLRTGAATGVATRHLSRGSASSLGLFGAGAQAETQLEVIAAVRTLDRVLVWSRSRDSAAAFCERVGDRAGLDVRPATSPDELLECDIVTTATTATSPVFDGRRLTGGAHVNAVGSNFASKAEIDIETVRRASLVVVDSLESAKIEGGDLIPAVDRGVLSWEHVVELGEVVSGEARGRESPESITIFKSHGVAAEDVIMAHEAYLRARDAGAGQEIEMFATDWREPGAPQR